MKSNCIKERLHLSTSNMLFGMRLFTSFLTQLLLIPRQDSGLSFLMVLNGTFFPLFGYYLQIIMSSMSHLLTFTLLANIKFKMFHGTYSWIWRQMFLFNLSCFQATTSRSFSYFFTMKCYKYSSNITRSKLSKSCCWSWKAAERRRSSKCSGKYSHLFKELLFNFSNF